MFMKKEEHWQIFKDNGLAASGDGATKDRFRKDKRLIMGNAHVWFWKVGEDGVQLLLQRRSLSKDVKPGWYHISAGGHINVGESAVEAAVRETREETGIMLDPEALHFVATMRIVDWAPNDLAHVYLYQLQGYEEFQLLDGEVESMDWYPIDTVATMFRSPDKFKIVDQGQLYFRTLIASLKHLQPKSAQHTQRVA